MRTKSSLKIIFIIILVGFLAIGPLAWLTGFFMLNLLPNNNFRPLDWFTKTPSKKSIDINFNQTVIKADLYLPKPDQAERYPNILLIHGANALGKDDPRIQNLAQTFARSKINALVPHLPNLTQEQFTPESSSEILAAAKWLTNEYNKKIGMASFSVASGPMFIAASDDTIKHQIKYLISFGGYFDLKSTLKYILTGFHEFEGQIFYAQPDPWAKEQLLKQYRKAFGTNQAVEDLFANMDPAKFEELYDQLPESLKNYINQLSATNVIVKIEAEKIFLVHSNPDLVVPHTESLKLHQLFSQRSELYILQSFTHVNVRLPQLTFDNIANYYWPEAKKLFRLIHNILSSAKQI